MNARILPGKASGTVFAPPSKSVAHRALIAAALSSGTSVIERVGSSVDIAATLGALRALGAEIEQRGDTVTVTGCDPRSHSGGVVDCKESGSTLRFLIPIFALGSAETHFTGQGRLPQRPQQVYAELFASRGLFFAQSEDGIRVRGPLTAGEYTLRGDVSSQFVTGLLFALPLCSEASRITVAAPFESRSYVQMTVGVLRDFGIETRWENENTLYIPGNQTYRPQNVVVEGDYSGAAFFGLLGAVSGPVCCRGLRRESAQGDAVFFALLRRFGALVTPLADGFAVEPGRLTAGEIDLADCPDLGPAAMVLGCFAAGETRLRNAARLRYKESDRIAAMEEELRRFGFVLSSTENEVCIFGARTMASQPEYTVDAHNDHRIAMSLAVCGAALEVPVTVCGAECVAKSYPEFFDDLRGAGIRVECSV